MARLSASITAEDHTQGRHDAPVTLVEYGDYECPYTRKARHMVHTLQVEYPEHLLFVYRHFPLQDLHPHARSAAAAAEAAGAQGEFWTMHEHLFARQHALEDADLHQYAVNLKLDADLFERDRTSPDTSRRIARDVSSGEASGVLGTPMFYVNGMRHDGPYDLRSLRAVVMAHLGDVLPISTIQGNR